MDNKIKRETDKKFDIKITRDRGDHLKRHANDKLKRSDREKAFLPDRGDTVRKLQTLNSDKRKFDQQKSKMNTPPNVENVDTIKKVSIEKPDKNIEKALRDLEARRRLKDKYALKLKNAANINNVNKMDDKSVQIDGKKIKFKKKDFGDTYLKAKGKPTDSSNESGKSDKGSCVQRRPIIKTIRNDATIYKAVTFIDQKRPTQLQITIPNDVGKKVNPTFTDGVTSSLKPNVKGAASKTSIKEKPAVAKKIVKKKPRSISPSHAISSPPTEVAKWVPSCINQHTKPYYEAWVNTTLAAISKNTNNDGFYLEQKHIIERFKRAFERPFTPDLVYENCNDERYTGRIRVKQR